MFKKQNRTGVLVQPIIKGLYAWTSLHAGSFILCVEDLTDYYQFLFLPGPSEYFLTSEDFSKCVKSNVLEFVEVLPDQIFEETVKFLLCSPPKQLNIITNEKQKD